MFQNGFISAIPFLLSYIIGVSSGQVADWLRYSKILTTGQVRKVFGTGGVYWSLQMTHLSFKFVIQTLSTFFPILVSSLA